MSGKLYNMKKPMNGFLILAIPLCLFACQWNKSIEPAFKDGGLTVRNLKDEWKCERIDFENWEGDDARDSSLTICLINSNSVPNPRSDNSMAILKMIAAEVKQ